MTLRTIRWLGQSLLAVLSCGVFWAFLLPAALSAQPTGAVYGTVTDSDGKPLAGVTVTLTGPEGREERRTDEKGRLRFLGLSAGRYTLEAEAEGYAKQVSVPLHVRWGRNATVQLQLSAALEETITVTTEPPLLDTSAVPSGLLVGEVELDEIPTTRDPWAVVSQTPGVILDRVNVGGSESGQQAVFVGRGSSSFENAYAIDGVNITDMAAVGASPTYFDFDMFGEIQVTVGGGDASLGNSGVLVNLVTKRGGNQWQGSARLFLTDDTLQSSPSVRRSDFAPGQEETGTNRIRAIEDWGAEAGGRLIRNHLWAWGAYALNDIDRDAFTRTRDQTELENFGLKLNAQGRSNLSAVASYNRNDKIRLGRGAGPDRSLASLWDQFSDAKIFRIGATYAPTDGFFTTGQLSEVRGTGRLNPKGGPDAEILLDSDGIWQGSFLASGSTRDSDERRVGATWLGRAWAVDHELEGEIGRRTFDMRSATRFGPRNLIHVASENTATELDQVEAYRPADLDVALTYDSWWIQDTITANRFSMRFGLRRDRQRGSNAATVGLANVAFPELLPAVSFPGVDAGFTWSTVSPRLSLTYALGSKGVLRAHYGHYPGQLHTELASRITPQELSGATLEFVDLDGDHIYDDGEDYRVRQFWGVYGDSPGISASPNKNDPRLKPELTKELILGFEYSPRSSIVLGMDLTLREVSRVLENRSLIRDESGAIRQVRREDYHLAGDVSGELPDGTLFRREVFELLPNLDYTAGSVLINGDRRQEYEGVSFLFTKRLANRWMMRGHLSFADWSWEIGPEFAAHDDPTDIALAQRFDSAAGDSSGDVVAEPFRGPRPGVFLNSRWVFNLSGLYQVAPLRPWGFTVAGNLYGREGFPAPYWVLAIPGDGQPRSVQVTGRGDSFRYHDIVQADLRAEKDFQLGPLAAVVSLDVFNALNDGSELERSLQLNGPQADYLRQTVSPRVWRLGLRIAWE